MMKTKAKISMLLFLVVSLMITPVSVIFASQDSDLSMMASKLDHKTNDIVQSEQNVQDQQSIAIKLSVDHSDSAHDKDSKHSDCKLKCSDCSHCVTGITNYINNSSINNSSKITILSQNLFQKFITVQYRPPKSLLS